MNIPPPLPQQNPLCHTCGQGALVRRKTFRMSGPVVAIGFILLVPSMLGMLLGIVILVGTAATTSQISPVLEKEVRSQLVPQHIPEPIIVKVVTSKPVDDSELQTLTPQQVSAVHQAEISSTGGKLGAGAGVALAGGFSIFVIVASFVGGLLGWLLIMRKRVLQCARCGAVVPAS
ncbi:MAG: hypothetical protein JWR69_2140 [Pedosphaera sp.]|nr:hypothetical protein [Pedosphaera sp.]